MSKVKPFWKRGKREESLFVMNSAPIQLPFEGTVKIAKIRSIITANLKIKIHVELHVLENTAIQCCKVISDAILSVLMFEITLC